MSIASEHRPRDLAAEVRRDARLLAERWSGAGPAFAGIVVVVLLMGASVALDYEFGQSPHRILKLALGLLVVGGIMLRPRFGLLLLPLFTPFLGLVPPTPIPGVNAFNVLIFSVFGAYAVGEALARRPILRAGRLQGAIGILVLIAVLSIVRGAAVPTGYSYNAHLASLDLFRSGTSFAMYFIFLAMARGERDRRRIAWAVLIGLLLESLVCLKLGRVGRSERALGTYDNPNELGCYLAIFTVLAAAVAFGVRSWLARLMAVGVFVLGSIGVMLTLSRGGMIALVGGLGIVVLRSSRWALGLCLLLLALSPLWVPSYVMDRITSSAVEDNGGGDVQVDNSSEIRLITWRAIMDVVEHHPLDGVGFAGLRFVLPNVGRAMGLGEVADSAHNTYLRTLGDMGVFGLLAFLWLLWSVWRLADAGVRSARSRFDRSLAVGLGGAIVTMAICCAFGDRFWSPSVSSGLWVMCALVEDSVPGQRTTAAA